LLEFRGLTLVYYIPVEKVENFLLSGVTPVVRRNKVRLYVQVLESVSLSGKGVEGLKVRELNYMIEAKYSGRKGYYAVKLYADNPQYVEWGVSQGFLKTLADISYREERNRVFCSAKKNNKVLARIEADVDIGLLSSFKGKLYPSVLSLIFLNNFIGVKEKKCEVLPIKLRASVLPARISYMDLAELEELGLLGEEKPSYVFYVKRIVLEIL